MVADFLGFLTVQNFQSMFWKYSTTNITTARYFIYVCLCAEFKAVMSLEKEETILNFEKWMNEKAYESPIFHYWKIIFDLLVLDFSFFLFRERKKLQFVSWFFKFVHEIHFCFEALQLCALAKSICWWFIEVRIYVFRCI